MSVYLRHLFCASFCSGSSVLPQVGVFVKHVIDNTPEVTAKDILPQGYTTSIVDQNGTVLEQLKDSDSNRVYKKYDEISKYMGDAFCCHRGERFYKHNGIDLQGIIRAGVVVSLTAFISQKVQVL